MTAVVLIAKPCDQPASSAPRWRMVGSARFGRAGVVWVSLLQVAPPDRFLGDDPIGAALIRLDRDSHRSGRIRIKARDSFYGDLQAAVRGIEKTNINDVFQLDHAARLYRDSLSGRVVSAPLARRSRCKPPLTTTIEKSARRSSTG